MKRDTARYLLQALRVDLARFEQKANRKHPDPRDIQMRDKLRETLTEETKRLEAQP